jgi:cytoskeletal protein RodZ
MAARRVLAIASVVLLAGVGLAGCVSTPQPKPTPTTTDSSTPSASPTMSPSSSPTPTATVTPTPSATNTAPDEGQSFESSFLSGVSAACADLASASNNQQLVDTQGRVIDTTNCNAIVKQIRVNTAGLTTKTAAYKRGYQATVDVLFAHAPLCDPQNNCINKSDLAG